MGRNSSTGGYGRYVPGQKQEILDPKDADANTILEYSNIIHKIIWKSHIPMADHEDAFQSIVLYTLRHLPQFDKNRSHFPTFLHYQSLAAIKEYWRSYSRNEKVCVEPRVPNTMQDNGEMADDPIEQLRDYASLTGRDIEENLERREILEKVIKIGREHYNIQNPFQASRKDRIKLQNLYMELSGKIPPKITTKLAKQQRLPLEI